MRVVVRVLSEVGTEVVGQQSFEFSPPNERLLLRLRVDDRSPRDVLPRRARRARPTMRPVGGLRASLHPHAVHLPQRELLRRVFVGEPWEAWMAELARSVRSGALDDELVYRKRIRRRLEDYEHNVPPHIVAARKLDHRVREIRYVITAQGPEPASLPHGRLDYEHYLSRQLAPAADSILYFLDTDFATVAGQQMTLFG